MGTCSIFQDRGKVKEDYETNKRSKGFKEQQLPFLHREPKSNMEFLNFTNLESIILYKKNWDAVFLNYFKDKQFVTQTFKELVYFRNELAHSSKLNLEDEAVFKVAVYKFLKCIHKDLKISDLETFSTETEVKGLPPDEAKGISNIEQGDWKIHIELMDSQSQFNTNPIILDTVEKMFKVDDSLINGPKTGNYVYPVSEEIPFQDAKRLSDIIQLLNFWTYGFRNDHGDDNE